MEIHLNNLASQQPDWPDSNRLTAVKQKLRNRQALASIAETKRLGHILAKATFERQFIIQVGPCAEPIDITVEQIHDLVSAAINMQTTIERISGFSTLPMFRLAGQFCKPRSKTTETIDGVTLPSFRGEIINGSEFTEESRTPDPGRMFDAHKSAENTRRILRQLLGDELFTAHEALLLDFELPQSEVDQSGQVFSTSANFLWIGDRTRELDGAHVEFCQAINNPIGVKLGPDLDIADLVELCQRLNPNRIPGRLSLIPRLGAMCISDLLPKFMGAIKADKHEVIWIIDPMHGNTISTNLGQKTRQFDTILAEIEQFFEVCEQLNIWPGGVHLEMSGQDVTECIGGDVQDLSERFETLCDPRVNREQALIIGEFVASRLNSFRFSNV